MRSKKSDNIETTGKNSISQFSKPKVVARTTKAKAEKRVSLPATAQTDAPTKSAGTIPSSADHMMSPTEQDLDAQIAKRAYELYEHRGWQHGHDLADWIQAAREISTSKSVR